MINEKYIADFASVSNKINHSVFILGSLTGKSKVDGKTLERPCSFSSGFSSSCTIFYLGGWAHWAVLHDVVSGCEFRHTISEFVSIGKLFI